MASTHEAALTDTKLSKISGNISRYKKTREMANFFFSDRDSNIMGLSAMAGSSHCRETKRLAWVIDHLLGGNAASSIHPYTITWACLALAGRSAE
jgi:hypothetical protein